MDTFRTLFGVKENAIRKTVVLLPFARKNILGWLGVESLARGKLFGAGQADGFTVVHTGMGAPFLGKAVLCLSDTAARDLILFSACGLAGRIGGLDLGSLVSVGKCRGEDAFTRHLPKETRRRRNFRPDRALHRLFLVAFASSAIREVSGVSLDSPGLGQLLASDFFKDGIQVIDLECSALFAAAGKINRRAAALLYVTDIAGEKPYYLPLPAAERALLFRNIQAAAKALCRLIREKLNV